MHWASLKSANPEISQSWWQDNLLRNPQYPEIQNSSADVSTTSSKPSENQIWRFSLTEMRIAAIGSVGYGEPGVSLSTPPEIINREFSHCPFERRERTKATKAELERGGSGRRNSSIKKRRDWRSLICWFKRKWGLRSQLKQISWAGLFIVIFNKSPQL